MKKYGSNFFGPKADSEQSLALGSVLFDTLNHVIIDSALKTYSDDERTMLLDHLDFVEENDILTLDRGYASIWLFFLLHTKKINFCCRIKENWKIAKQLLESEKDELLVKVTLPKKDISKLSLFPEYAKKGKEITIRLVKVVLENGEIEILSTSLLDSDIYQTSDFKELYHLRWTIEENYKLLKCRINLEQFSGKTALAIEQDFFSKLFLLSLTAILTHKIAEKVKIDFSKNELREHDQQINRTSAIASTQTILIKLFLLKITNGIMEAFDKIVYQTREIIRPERFFPHKKKMNSKFAMNIKPL